MLKAFCLLILILVAPLLSAQTSDRVAATLDDPAVKSGDDLLSGSDAENLSLIDMVKVVTRGGRPADCLAPVVINRIDGEHSPMPAQGFLIEAGVHTLNGKASLDISSCPLPENKLQFGGAEDFEVLFEPGATYHIAYDHSSENTDQWSLVVWKVELPLPPNEAPDIMTEDADQP